MGGMNGSMDLCHILFWFSKTLSLNAYQHSGMLIKLIHAKYKTGEEPFA